jgi:hypothetical protein
MSNVQEALVPIHLPNDLSCLSGREYFVVVHYYGLGGYPRLSTKEIGKAMRVAVGDTVYTQKGKANNARKKPITHTRVLQLLHKAIWKLTRTRSEAKLGRYVPPVGDIVPAKFPPIDWMPWAHDDAARYRAKTMQELQDKIVRAEERRKEDWELILRLNHEIKLLRQETARAQRRRPSNYHYT